MKKVLGWILRILCIAIICAAGVTLCRCLMHINDDHSYEKLMGDTVQSQPMMEEQSTVQTETPAAPALEELDEEPVVTLSCVDSVTIYQPFVTVSAAFGQIQSSITADLNWYVNGELAATDEQRLLVEGSTVSSTLRIDSGDAEQTVGEIRLEVSFQGKTIAETRQVTIARENGALTSAIRTEEIRITVLEDCYLYDDSELTTRDRTLEKGSEGYLLNYQSFDNNEKSIQVQLDDGVTVGWMDAAYAEISSENCTTTSDYSEEDKENFVNDMRYDSETDYLIWVSLYSQRVNVFQGSVGSWQLLETFSCSTGCNETPTTTGVYRYQSRADRWDLGATYVAPVMVYNGGEAFTSQPYNTVDDTIADQTLGAPSSGGSVRMKRDDIEWMSDRIPLSTSVVVY